MPQSAVDELTIPFHEQKTEMKQKLNPKTELLDQPDFIGKVKPPQETFSDPAFFNTVFISGDDMVKEMTALKQKEIDDFNKKIVVENKHFFVHTRNNELPQHVLDRQSDIREGDVKKLGLRLNHKKLRELTGRQILATKDVPEMPVSVLSKEPFVPGEAGHVPPMKAKLDLTKTPAAQDPR